MNRLYRPRSFVSLLLSGFIFVALPLVVALFSSVQILDGLVQQSAVAVFRSVGRIENSRKVVDLLLRQERSARLYQVLGESTHLDEVNKAHQELQKIFTEFAGFHEDKELAELISQLQEREFVLVTMLSQEAPDPETRKKQLEEALTGYGEISSLSSQLSRSNNTLMVKEIDLLKENVQINKRTLIWQVSGLIGFSVLLVILFMVIIIKPINQLDRGIERLGAGDFATPIVVSGAKDMEAVGEKLDWLRKRLEKLDREKVKMIAHISHELKTPLASIKEGAGLLKDGLVGPLTESQEEVVSILDSNCDKLQRLIQNILDFNMAEAKQLPNDVENIRIDEIIAEVAGDHHNPLLARNVQLKMHLEKVAVVANKKQMKTVIDNLLSNAVKFTPDNGIVRILMKLKGDKVNILVEDSGPGVAEEDRSQIFLPFFQGGQKNKSVVKGSGLGLAISKEYVQNCGGTLRLLPSSNGARFSVTLPCMREGVV